MVHQKESRLFKNDIFTRMHKRDKNSRKDQKFRCIMTMNSWYEYIQGQYQHDQSSTGGASRNDGYKARIISYF